MHDADAPTPYLQLSGIRKSFGTGDAQVVALGNIELSVRQGEFLAIVGPSGCGKSTLLQIAAGLAHPTAGQVRFEGQIITEPPPGTSICSSSTASRCSPGARCWATWPSPPNTCPA
jgi:ABC-type Fe3+/spermidine/putrescine transport system ATPase subunit